MVDIISVGLVLLLHGEVGAGLGGIACEDFSLGIGTTVGLEQVKCVTVKLY